MGIAMLLAVVLGVGTTALAAAPGDPFKLGRLNSVDKISKLVGSTSGALLKGDNDGSGTALDLQVEEGEPPMTVDSAIQVNDFNADQVDGRSADDFISDDNIYTVIEGEVGAGGGTEVTVFADCDSGDKLLGGGGGGPSSLTSCVWATRTARVGGCSRRTTRLAAISLRKPFAPTSRRCGNGRSRAAEAMSNGRGYIAPLLEKRNIDSNQGSDTRLQNDGEGCDDGL